MGSTTKGITIGALVGVIATLGIVVALTSGAFTKSIAAGDKAMTTPEGKESVLISSNPFEAEKADPIQVYHNCAAEMMTDKGRPSQQAFLKCWDDGVTWTQLRQPTVKPIATFHFNAPDKLVDTGMMCCACRSAVYVYENNTYELAFPDQVNEKRYPATLYQLPS